ncbi:MAG: DUF1287 domain-containing protein [Deltaproteobacteria bacterium]|nr:DUF1287 domain-containing protein [Deltaproteobacteria bacterium]
MNALAAVLVLTTSAASKDALQKVLDAAEAEVARRVRYDISQRYRKLVYKNGVFVGRPVYPGGDLDPQKGVCTDLIVRAFRAARIDFQKLVHEDAKRAPKAYRLSRWRQKRPDRSIDHRRVPNLLTYLRRHARVVETDADLCPGDVVIWDLSDRGWPDHIGLVSRRQTEVADGGVLRPLMIHNYPDPGHTTEADVLTNWKIVGRFRLLADEACRPQR